MKREMKVYRLRLGAVSNAWSRPVRAENEDDALRKFADSLASKTIDYYRRECWDIEQITEGTEEK